jgi:hypothetical protein
LALNRSGSFRATKGQSDSHFRGQASLCKDLQCSNVPENVHNIPADVKSGGSNQISVINEAPYSQQKMSDYYQNQISQLQRDNGYCWEENQSLSEKITRNLETCSAKLDKCFDRTYISEPVVKQNYQSNHILQELPSIIQYEIPSNPANWDRIRVLGYGSFLEQIINLIVLPITLCDPRAVLYRGRAPFALIRYACAALTLYIYYQIASMIFNLVTYALRFLPEPPPIKEKLEKEPEKKKNKRFFRKKKEELKTDEPFFSLNIGELLDGVIKLSRGGSSIKPLTSFEKD